ncbi:hypothetical protein T02_14472 [Trichinella nativa]|uniref:Uncharacterized protein n=1 Tax=Trichinella nativa TaxID=6335 RepID=A0A0V1KK71_9BILA|nr:hypothetical protein T02_14472 [Trichinella nativa]
MPCLHKQGTYHRNDFAQDATQERFSENSLHSEFEAALTAIRLVLSIAEYSDD